MYVSLGLSEAVFGGLWAGRALAMHGSGYTHTSRTLSEAIIYVCIAQGTYIRS